MIEKGYGSTLILSSLVREMVGAHIRFQFQLQMVHVRRVNVDGCDRLSRGDVAGFLALYPGKGQQKVVLPGALVAMDGGFVCCCGVADQSVGGGVGSSITLLTALSAGMAALHACVRAGASRVGRGAVQRVRIRVEGGVSATLLRVGEARSESRAALGAARLWDQPVAFFSPTWFSRVISQDALVGVTQTEKSGNGLKEFITHSLLKGSFPSPALNAEIIAIFEFARVGGFCLQFQHVLGVLNVEADAISREDITRD
ncbi:hypothetical protein BC829DRAFT_444010 [Chytridium lagenaria]|nr:hypothetical protein BC829DRAFT_444010 [Chytridium lagenaria]